MADTDTSTTDTQDAGTEPSGESAAPQGHHSQRQPRDEAQRFAKEKPAEAPAVPSRFKRVVKRHGKEETEEADLDELWRARDEVARLQHLNRASTERFQRAAELQKQVQTTQQIAEALVKRDLGPLKDYFTQNKLDPKDALADLLEAALQDEAINPEQRELMQLRAEKAAREEQDRRAKEDAEVEAFYAEVEKLRPETEAVMNHALQHTNLPKTAKMLETVARIYLEAAEAGTKLAPEQVAEYARWELVEVNGGLVNELEPGQFVQHFAPLVKKLDESMSAEDFEKALPALAKRYQRALLERVKGGAPTRGAAPVNGNHRRPTAPQKKDERLLEPFLDGI